MRLIVEYNNYIDAKVTRQTTDEEAVHARSGEEKEERRLVVFRPPTKNPEAMGECSSKETFEEGAAQTDSLTSTSTAPKIFKKLL